MVIIYLHVAWDISWAPATMLLSHTFAHTMYSSEVSKVHLATHTSSLVCEASDYDCL